MYKITLCTVLVCLLCSHGCASHNTRDKIRENSDAASINNYITAYSIGMQVADDRNGLLVTHVDTPFAATAADIHEGDIVSAVNGARLNRREYISLMDRNRGERVLITINRNDELIDYALAPKKIVIAPSMLKIRDLVVFEKRKVVVAVIVTDMRDHTKWRHHLWEKQTRHKLQGEHESKLRALFSGEANFMLVNRVRLDTVLEELKDKLSGLTFHEAGVRIGTMTNASHLLTITFARYPKGRNNCSDTITTRLIEVASGNVLAIDRYNKDCQ